MREIKLLDRHDSEVIRNITANRTEHTLHYGDGKFVRIPISVAYQGEGEVKPATKRATCRLCNTKIKEGMQLSFYYDEEDNSWTAKTYHVHADGCPCHHIDAEIEPYVCTDCGVEVGS